VADRHCQVQQQWGVSTFTGMGLVQPINDQCHRDCENMAAQRSWAESPNETLPNLRFHCANCLQRPHARSMRRQIRLNRGRAVEAGLRFAHIREVRELQVSARGQLGRWILLFKFASMAR